MKTDWGWTRISVPYRGSGQSRDLRIWLLDHVDDRDWIFDGADHDDMNRRIFFFARREDAILFALTWL